MTEEEIPDYHIFMMCEELIENTLSVLHTGFYFRNCRPDELEIWKAFPFDSEKVPAEYEDFMNQFIKETYNGEFIPRKDFEKLKITDPPPSLIRDLENETTIQF